MDVDISMDLHANSVDMDLAMDVDGKFHIPSKHDDLPYMLLSIQQCIEVGQGESKYAVFTDA